MRTIPEALQSHLDTGTCTLAYCWKVTLRNGKVLGFTNHDEDLYLEGQLYSAGGGMTSSEIQSNLSLGANNLTAEGTLRDFATSQAICSILDHDELTEQALASGVFDGASVEVLLVNWASLAQETP